ncbi:MAG: hypothetical protein WC322_03310 [Candidatus Paceibacterota bacterium]|jgi:hypothetical protein
MTEVAARIDALGLELPISDELHERSKDDRAMIVGFNGHNLTDPRIFVESGWRNEEWKTLRQTLADLRAHTGEGEK